MSIICSSHNLGEMEELNNVLSMHYYALRLLMSVPEEEWNDEFRQLLSQRISFMSDVVLGFERLERCIRAGRDFNAEEPVLLDDSMDSEQSEDSPEGCV